MKSIFITGTEGFVGKHLKEALAQRADFQLFCPTMAELDLTQSQAVSQWLNTTKPDIIIHTATSQTIGKGYATDVCEQNLRMFFNLTRHRPPCCVLYTLCSGSSYNRENWIEGMPED